MRVLYITGMGRSGSTLLDRLLGQVEGVAAHGELVRLWTRALTRDIQCSCGARFARCPFWSAVGEHAFGGWHRLDAEQIASDRRRVDRLRHVPRLVTGSLTDLQRSAMWRRVDLFQRLYEGIAATAGADVVVDSSKDISTALLLGASDTLDLRLVHLVRDPRGVAHSWGRRTVRPDAEAGEAPELARYSAVTVAARYVAHNAVLSALARDPGRTLVVRYEDLVTDPAGTIARVVAHAGMHGASTPFVRGDTSHLQTGHSVGGNPMRFRAGPVQVRVDDRWRHEMPRSTQAIVTAVALPLLRRYGYDTGVEPPILTRARARQ